MEILARIAEALQQGDERQVGGSPPRPSAPGSRPGTSSSRASWRG
jgi:hypothetical protein